MTGRCFTCNNLFHVKQGNSAPSRIRTHNPLIRSQVLCPIELWAHDLRLSQSTTIDRSGQLGMMFRVLLGLARRRPSNPARAGR